MLGRRKRTFGDDTYYFEILLLRYMLNNVIYMIILIADCVFVYSHSRYNFSLFIIYCLFIILTSTAATFSNFYKLTKTKLPRELNYSVQRN